MDNRQRADLDRYITGNWGEDYFSDENVNEQEDDMPEEKHKICPYCGGTGLNYTNPNDGGSCPSCIGGYVI